MMGYSTPISPQVKKFYSSGRAGGQVRDAVEITIAAVEAELFYLQIAGNIVSIIRKVILPHRAQGSRYVFFRPKQGRYNTFDRAAPAAFKRRRVCLLFYSPACSRSGRAGPARSIAGNPAGRSATTAASFRPRIGGDSRASRSGCCNPRASPLPGSNCETAAGGERPTGNHFN
jgi:hypothetical protein